MLGFFDGDFCFFNFLEGSGGGSDSFFKGNRNFPWRGGFFLGGPRGDSESPPLGPSKPPVTPLKRAAQRGPAGPLAATGFPRRRTDLIKVGNSSLNEPSYAGLGGSPAGSGQRPAV